MMRIAEVSLPACHAHGNTHVHCHSQPKPAYPRLMHAMAKVSFVGLAILACVTSVQLFLPAAVLGALHGLYERHTSGEPRLKEASFGGCSQGLWEDFAQVKFPLPVALLAGVAAAAVHIDHHPAAFVPLAGFAFGTWVGSLSAPAVSLCVYKFRQLVSQK